MNYIRAYWNEIQNGHTAVPRRIIQQYKILIDELDHPINPWVFNEEIATRPIEFIQKFCKQSKGRWIGKEIELQLFQKAKFQAIFGLVHKDSKLRRCREVLTIEGRKNGKSCETSGIGNFMLTADGEGGPQVCCVATKKDQATCATLTIMKAGSDKKYVLQKYFIPEELIDIRKREDKIPYDIWVENEWITACPGNKVQFSAVTAWFNKMRDKYEIIPLWIYYDRALAGYWVQEMESNGYSMVKCAQGAMTFSQPMRSMEADFKSKLINYNNNPVLKWCLTNTSVKRDDNDNIRPIKGQNRRMRVDGTFSLLDSYVGLFEKMEDYKALI